MSERDSERLPISDDTYQRLHQAIVRGHLLPNERLVELDLAKTYATGRAAVRMALARLEQDGLVDREPHRGAHVRAVSGVEAIEMIETRAVLEGLAARHAALRATEQDVGALHAIQREMEARLAADDLLGFSEHNTQLHDAILRIANHATVERLLARLRAQHVLFRYRTLLTPGRAPQSLDEHRAIIVAIAAHNAAEAEAAMQRHLNQAATALRHALARIGEI